MCGRQWAQVIDNGPLSMLGNEISSPRFVGLKKPKRTERERERERDWGSERERGRWREKRRREITERLHSGDRAGRTDGLTEERDRGRTRESNLLEIKSDRMKKKKKRERGIIGVFLLLPSLLWTVISHQGTPSLWISSSLRQFHSPLSVSVTQSFLLSQSEFSCRPSALHYILPHWPWGPSWLLFVELCWERLPSFSLPLTTLHD